MQPGVRRLLSYALATFAALIIVFSGAQAQPNPNRAAEDRYALELKLAWMEIATYDKDDKARIRMRDGARLTAEVYYPKQKRENLPTILMRTPYGTDASAAGQAVTIEKFLKNGYVVVMGGVRGTYWSEGDQTILVRADKDGYDTLDWIVEQPWSNGKIGTFGCSYGGENQLVLMAENHPAHAAAIPLSAGGGVGALGRHFEQGGVYRGGAFQNQFMAWMYRRMHIHWPEPPAHFSQDDIVRMSRFHDLVPTTPAVDWYRVARSLPAVDRMKEANGPETDYERYLKMAPGDRKWKNEVFVGEEARIDIPALWGVGWYDWSIEPVFDMVKHVERTAPSARGRDNQFIIASPLPHCYGGEMESENTIVGERNLGDARFDYDKLYLDWFDHWLKGVDNGVTDRPKVQAYLTGANEWRFYEDFTPPGAEKLTLYFDSDGDANSLYGDGRLHWKKPNGEKHNAAPSKSLSDTFTYDPANPTPTYGGGPCCFNFGEFVGAAYPGSTRPGSFDQRPVEARQDVLVYTSEPLTEGLNVTGMIEATIFVSSDAKDTDFTIKLVDVAPDGAAFNVSDTIQRARYRESYTQPTLMEPGKVYELSFTPMAASNFFKKGHRIRVEISSANFPRYDFNLNTGGDNWSETEWNVARNTVHHGGAFSSRIALPVVRD